MPYGDNLRAPRVDIHSFAMIPRPDIPRSTFRRQAQHKTTISASYLIPVYVDEVLPGDTFTGTMTAFVRMSTPLYPIMDNLDMESWFFFVPARILWSHWVNFMGEQPASPADSISYTIPSITSVGGPAAFTVYDYMGIPTTAQIGAGTITFNALPLRAYNMIWNQWFRDQNLDTAVGYGATNTVYDLGDGPDPGGNYSLLQVRKRHDYFTSALPWTQKGGTAITLPLGTSATVKTSSTLNLYTPTQGMAWTSTTTALASGSTYYNVITGSGSSSGNLAGAGASGAGPATLAVAPGNLYADLSTATAATINQIRLAFQTQRLLERDARGGTRYQETVMAHFGVKPLDMRVQRPEYIGGGRTPVNIAPVPQTSGTGASGTTSPLGNLAAVGTAVSRMHGFRASFTEHGYILGLVAIRADMSYQQGMRRLWTRSTRYDIYYPVFAGLGEQIVRNDEIYTAGASPQDTNAFGYQERYAEYRYLPSLITGAFRSIYATPLDAWHLSQKFTALPTLASTFIADPTSVTLARNLAAGAAANNEQFLCDFFFDIKSARPMPMYGVPGLIDHF